MTKEDLRDYQHLVKNIESIEEEIQHLRDSIDVKSMILTDMPKGTTQQDKMAEAVASIVDTEIRLAEEWMRLQYKRLEIDDAISKLNECEKRIVVLRYIHGWKWENICVDIGYAWTQTHKVHGDALRKMKSPNTCEHNKVI